MILDLRPDESLFEAGAAREVNYLPWKHSFLIDDLHKVHAWIGRNIQSVHFISTKYIDATPMLIHFLKILMGKVTNDSLILA